MSCLVEPESPAASDILLVEHARRLEPNGRHEVEVAQERRAGQDVEVEQLCRAVRPVEVEIEVEVEVKLEVELD